MGGLGSNPGPQRTLTFIMMGPSHYMSAVAIAIGLVGPSPVVRLVMSKAGDDDGVVFLECRVWSVMI